MMDFPKLTNREGAKLHALLEQTIEDLESMKNYNDRYKKKLEDAKELYDLLFPEDE